MNAAKFTLTSTVVAAALGLAFGLMNTPAQAHTTACDTKPDHKHCPVAGGIVYEAELTDGAFDFCPLGGSCGAIEVTPNTRENVLRSDTDLDMVRPDFTDDPDGYDTWNAVFNACEEMLGVDTVDSFSAGRADWSVDKAGGVRVVFRNVELLATGGEILGQGAEFRVQLMGDEFDFIAAEGKSFPPEPGETSVFELLDFAITGTPERGKGAIKSCRGTDGGGPLLPPSTLVITASAP